MTFEVDYICFDKNLEYFLVIELSMKFNKLFTSRAFTNKDLFDFIRCLLKSQLS